MSANERNPRKSALEFLEAREDTTEAFESAEETFALVALLVNGMIVVPGMQAVELRRNHRNSFPGRAPTAGFVAFVKVIAGLTRQQARPFNTGILGR